MWIESLTGSSFVYNGPDITGNYVGNGTRIFIESDNGTITNLPTFGSAYQDISGNVYSGIWLQTLEEKNTHKTDGNGRTIVANYSTMDFRSTERTAGYGSYTGTIKVVNKESKSYNASWAWYKGGLGNDAGFTTDVINSSGVSGQSLYWQIPNGIIKRRAILDDDAELNSFISAFVNVAGKVNTTSCFGFHVGNVLLQSFDADKEIYQGEEKWIAYCTYSWQIIPGIDRDCFQYIPSTEFINGEKFNRPVLVERSDGVGIVTNKSLLYGYADLATFDSTWA